MQRSQRSQLAHEKNDRRRASEVPRERSHCGADESVRPRETDRSESPRVRKASTTADACRSRLSWRHRASAAANPPLPPLHAPLLPARTSSVNAYFTTHGLS